MMKSHPLLAAYQPHLAGFNLAVSFQTVAELLEGGVLAGWGDKRWAELSDTLAGLTVYHSTYETCEQWAIIRARDADNRWRSRIAGSPRPRWSTASNS